MSRVYVPPRKFTPAVIAWRDVDNADLPLKVPGCAWITDESIEQCLVAGHLEDVSAPQTAESHHAARIASLVTLLRAGCQLHPIHLHVNHRIAIYDGSHRFRAYEYLGLLDSIPVKLTGHNAPRLLLAEACHA